MASQILSSPFETCWDHDIFLSFRGEDTRKNFIDHLYKALIQVGIRTFQDNEELPRGKTISTELSKAIRRARICIVIFSKGYAFSTWYLDELAEIIECCQGNISQTFLPIFYHVDPSDVRKQTGTFGEAFLRHEEQYQTDMRKVGRWREALTKAGSFSGWDLSSVADGYEGNFIDKILDQVLCELNLVDFQVAEYPVGINPKAEEILNKLKVLNLKNSEYIIKSPNFAKVPHLEVREGCIRLVEVHESIGVLKELVELNLKGCISLSNLPSNIGNLESLKTFDMSHCIKLFELLEQVGNMMALTEIHGNRAITEQRLSFLGLLKNHKIEFFGCEQKFSNSWLSCLSYWISPKSLISISLPLASISRFRYLENLDLGYCGLYEDNFPIDLEKLSSLVRLDLSGNNFHTTPPGISRLPKLLRFHLKDCTTLQSISEVPTSLRAVRVERALILSRFSNSLDMEPSPIFSECESYDEVNLLKLISLPFIDTLQVDNSIRELSSEHIQFPIIFLPNTEVPNWFSHRTIGSLISFCVPPPSKCQIEEILVCACYGQMPYALNCTSSDGHVVAISVYNKTKDSNLSLHTKVPLHFSGAPCHIYGIPVLYFVFNDILCYGMQQCYCFSLDSQRIYFHSKGSRRSEMVFGSGDEMEVSIEFRGGFEVRKCGIHLQPGPSYPWLAISEDDVVTLKWHR